ncbi:MAG: molybdenum cofactor biosynthesis protein MoaE [Desulfobacteraceae bacterium]|nr:MAG: molybdenum cofactor biosynthesis protein MoaE [Desulfobacteraceae bacterium]
MNMSRLLDQIKKHPDIHKAGMILCHNGIVRETSRDNRKVSGLKVEVDHEKLEEIIRENKSKPGIIEILVEISENQNLAVGDDVMMLAVAGDIRDNVIRVLEDTLNAIKSAVTRKTEYFR